MIVGAALFALLAQAAPAATAPAAPPPATKARIQAEVKANFDRLDANKDGFVDKAEAQKGLDLEVAAREKRRSDGVSAAFARLDTNKDGSLSRAEFDAISNKVRAPTGNPYLTENDTNKDGRVSLSELAARTSTQFDAMDRDKNGVLSPQELRAAAAAQARARASR